MTDFRARGTIMGPAGLTAVFGMGTGVAPPVWSPGKRPAGGQARRPRCLRWSVTHESIGVTRRRMAGIDPRPRSAWRGIVVDVAVVGSTTPAVGPAACVAGRRRIGVVKPLGC